MVAALLQRTFLSVALALTLAAAAVLFLHVAAYVPSADTAPVDARVPLVPIDAGGTSLLSRLHLAPRISGKRELVGIIVENHESARPHQRGLEHALLIVEFPVEGLISRFLAVFDRSRVPPMVGPVRSLRPYFVDAAQPWVRGVVHAGGSPEAFERAATASGFQAVNLLAHTDRSLRLDGIPAPHDLFLPAQSVSLLLDSASPTAWPPYPTGRTPSGGSGAVLVDIDFHNPAHNVRYTYDPRGDRYVRLNGDVTSAAEPENVIVAEIPIRGIGELGRLDILPEGEGPLVLFRSGTAFAGTWRKARRGAPWEFLDVAGEPLRLSPGLTWMTVIPGMERLTWQ